MHARVTMAQVQPDRFAEATTIVQQTFQPAAREQPGFKAFMLLADPATHQLIGITLWETEADMTASAGASGYYQQQMADFGALLMTPATTTTHEVAAFETADQHQQTGGQGSTDPTTPPAPAGVSFTG